MPKSRRRFQTQKKKNPQAARATTAAPVSQPSRPVEQPRVSPASVPAPVAKVTVARHTHVSAELKMIAITTAIIMVILVVLALVLR